MTIRLVVASDTWLQWHFERLGKVVSMVRNMSIWLTKSLLDGTIPLHASTNLHLQTSIDTKKCLIRGAAYAHGTLQLGSISARSLVLFLSRKTYCTLWRIHATLHPAHTPAKKMTEDVVMERGKVNTRS